MTYEITLRIKDDDGMKVEKKVKDVLEVDLDNEVAETSKEVLETVYN